MTETKFVDADISTLAGMVADRARNMVDLSADIKHAEAQIAAWEKKKRELTARIKADYDQITIYKREIAALKQRQIEAQDMRDKAALKALVPGI